MGHFPLPAACWNPCFSQACSWIPLQLIQLGRKSKIHIEQEHVWVGIRLERGVCWLRSCFLGSTTTQELLLGGFPAENHIPKIQLIPAGCKKRPTLSLALRANIITTTIKQSIFYSCSSLLFPFPSLIPLKEGVIIN